MERKNNNRSNIKNFPQNTANKRNSSLNKSKTRQTNSRNNKLATNTKTSRNQSRATQNTRLRNQNRATGRSTLEKPRVKRKKRNNIILARVFTFLIFILIISYFGISIYKSLRQQPITYETLNYGTIDSQKLATGIIIRNETVYTATADGVLEFYKSENDKVKTGETVASIKDQEIVETTEQELEEINQAILEIQQSRDELSIFSEDIKKVNSQIQNILENGVYELATYDMSAIYELKNSVSSKLDIKTQMLLSESSGSLSQLASQRIEKENTINSNTQKITIDSGGILSYYTDGLEETFTFEILEQITQEQTKMKAESESLSYKMQVLTGEKIFKVVESNEFYIASYIETSYITDWTEGSLRTIYVVDSGGYTPQEVTIEKIDLGEKVSYVLLKSTKNILDFIEKRNISFEIAKPQEGFKINNTAIVEKNFLKIPIGYVENNIVIKKTEDGTKSIFIEEMEENETDSVYYIPIQYGQLSIGDTIINPNTNEEYTISDIHTEKGIYIVNSGIYKFTKINLENSISNDTYTILDPTFNTSIRIYDRFIPDAKSILQEELIYN